jgi:DNA polymerase-3 subunit delta
MVAIRTGEADRFIARDLGAFSAFLVFGTDVGLISERVRQIVRSLVDDPTDPFQLVRLDGDEIARDRPRLLDEAQTVPLFGGRRAVLVDVGSKPIVPAVEAVLATSLACPIVFEAGALKSDSALRRTIERARHAAAIECAPDDEREIGRLIDSEIAAAGLTIEADAKAVLAALLGADRLASRSEIGKLVLYARGQAVIGVEDVEAAVADASALAAEGAIDAAFAGDHPALDKALQHLALKPAEAGTLLSAALRHAVMLHRIKLGGGQTGFYRSALSPRRRLLFDRQLASLDGGTLVRIVTRLGEAVGETRRGSRLAVSEAERALWMVAQAARSRVRG